LACNANCTRKVQFDRRSKDGKLIKQRKYDLKHLNGGLIYNLSHNLPNFNSTEIFNKDLNHLRSIPVSNKESLSWTYNFQGDWFGVLHIMAMK
jgi:hypothetical protein